MEMTFDEVFNSLDSICENALLEFEIAELNEAAGDGEGKKKSSDFLSAARKTLERIWDAVIAMFTWIKEKAIAMAAAVNAGSISVSKGDTINGAVDFAAVMKYASEAKKAVMEDGEELPDSSYLTESIKQNATVSFKEMAKCASSALTLAKYFRDKSGSGNGEKSEAEKKSKEVANVLSRVGNECTKILNEVNKQPGVSDKVAAARSKVKASYADENPGKKLTESASYNSCTPSEKMALLLVEAASILENEDSERLNESAGSYSAAEKVALLLVESANILAEEGCGGCYCSGAEGGEGTQKDIDDIPEERPEEDDEYDTDVNGADGDPDMEVIKDLVGNDSTAMKLLTDDEGGACCESIVINFGF